MGYRVANAANILNCSTGDVKKSDVHISWRMPAVAYRPGESLSIEQVGD